MITQTVTWGSGQTPWSAFYNVAQFNPSIGTLTSVELNFSGYSWGDLSLVHHSGNNVTRSSSLGAQITLYDVVQNPILTISPTTAFSDTFDGKVTLSHTVLEPNAAVANGYGLYTSNLSRWLGNGNWSVTGAAQNSSVAQSDPQIALTSNAIAKATLTVTYNYDPEDTPEVPEPGAFLLIGSGLIGLCMLLRKRSA